MSGEDRFTIPTDDSAIRRSDMRILQNVWDGLRAHLRDDGYEHAAILICGLREREDSLTFLVRESILLSDADYVNRGSMHLSVAPTTLSRAAKRARMLDAAVVMVHSHPFPGGVRASNLDLLTEYDLCRRVLAARTGKPAAGLVVGPDGVDGRIWTPAGAVRFDSIRVIGETISTHHVTSHGLPPVADDSGRVAPQVVQPGPERHREESATARQELLWGAEGQQVLRNSHVVVVGAGGTGSHAATQLAHLRVGRLTLIDHDPVEVTNLSWIVGLGPDDVGNSKVAAMTDRLLRIHPECSIAAVADSVLNVDPAILCDADVMVCATDGHGSQSLLNDLVHQYYVPVVDLAVEVVPEHAFRAGGGVRVLRPGEGCLWCAQTLSAALVREEYLSEDERAIEAERGYLRGTTLPHHPWSRLTGSSRRWRSWRCASCSSGCSVRGAAGSCTARSSVPSVRRACESSRVVTCAAPAGWVGRVTRCASARAGETLRLVRRGPYRGFMTDAEHETPDYVQSLSSGAEQSPNA